MPRQHADGTGRLVNLVTHAPFEAGASYTAIGCETWPASAPQHDRGVVLRSSDRLAESDG